MIGRFKILDIYQNNRRLFLNFFSLSALQATNVIIPLLVYPYLIRTLGIEKFGSVVFAQAFINYFIVLTDYGFNLSATREISVTRNNQEKINQTFNSVLTAKIFLCILSFFVFSSVVFLIPKFSNEWPLFYLSFTMVIGQILMPVWFYQGMEQMKYITYLNVFSKIAFTLLILLFIKKQSDYIYANVLLGAGNFLSSIISILIAKNKFGIKLKIASFVLVKKQLREGWAIFISNFSIMASMYSNIFILGLFADPITIGFYGIAEKVFMVLRTFAVLFYQTIYPKVCLLANDSFEKLIVFFRGFIRIVFLFFIPVSVFTFLCAEKIIVIFSGKSIPQAAFLLKILCIGPIFAALNIPACQTMLAYNFNKSYAWVSTSGALLNVILNLILVRLFMATGTAISAIVTEISVSVLLYSCLKVFYSNYSVISVLNVFQKNEKV
jgi:PST family polysaccharide transporter